MARSAGYQVRVRVDGQLDPGWSASLAGLLVTAEADGSTRLCGELPDQAALHGLLATIRDLGLSLISVETTAIPGSRTVSGGAS